MYVTVKGRGRIQNDDLAEGLAIALRDDYGKIALNVKEINTSVVNRLDVYDESQEKQVMVRKKWQVQLGPLINRRRPSLLTDTREVAKSIDILYSAATEYMTCYRVRRMLRVRNACADRETGGGRWICHSDL